MTTIIKTAVSKIKTAVKMNTKTAPKMLCAINSDEDEGIGSLVTRTKMVMNM